MKRNIFKNSGFTAVELVVVVAIIGTLAALGIVGWRSWQQSAAQRQVQSDIKQASVAMDSSRTFNESGYPTSIPTSFSADAGVTVTYFGGNGSNYCIQAQSVKYATIQYYIDTTQGKEPKVGTCSSSPNFALSAPSPSISASSSSSIVVTWANVTNATGYTVKYGTASPTIVSSCTSSPCTINNLSGSTLYRANVMATNSFTSATSATVSTTTPAALAPPAAPTVTYTTTIKSGSKTYNITAGGGACAAGTTTEWKFFITETRNGDPVELPDWGTVSWQTANTKTHNQITNGFQAPGIITVYAKPRCTNGAASTEYSSYATYP